jgi:hypothetical protein
MALSQIAWGTDIHPALISIRHGDAESTALGSALLPRAAWHCA